MKARGSAIIIAMLMIAAIGGLAFAIARLLFIESVSASYYANGSVAYYAAESGMEEGFLRYRYNRNSEIPFNGWTIDNENGSYTVGEGVFRSNVTDSAMTSTGTSYGGYDKSNTPPDVAKQYFDLRIGYVGTDKWPWFGPPDSTTNGLDKDDFPTPADTTAPYYVRHDNSIKVDLTGFSFSNPLKIVARVYGIPATFSSADKCKILMEAKLTVEDGPAVNEYKSLISYSRSVCGSLLSPGVRSGKLFLGSVTSSLASATESSFIVNRVQDLIDIDNSGVVPTSSTAKVSLYLKPLYYDMAIGIANTNCTAVSAACDDKGSAVSGSSTKIESIGYYGGTTRKLEADIDRQSGALYDLFDYVIYKTN